MTPAIGAARPSRPHEGVDGAAASAWLDRVTGRSGDARSALELPLLMLDDAATLRKTEFDASGMIAHAAARLARMRFRESSDAGRPREAIVACVGGVAVEPRARGRGVARRVVRSLLDAARLRGADLAVLWSEADALYRSLGFAPAGTEVVCALDRSRFVGPSNGALRVMRSSDAPYVVAMRERQRSVVARDRATWARLWGIPGAKWFVFDPNGVPAAYLVYERGADLRNVVHEWGGDVERLPDAIAGLFRRIPHDETFVVLPSWETSAREALERRGAETVAGPLCMAKPLHLGARVEDLDDAWFSGLDSM